jgi:GNAT superfamily N-acetyltransferase
VTPVRVGVRAARRADLPVVAALFQELDALHAGIVPGLRADPPRRIRQDLQAWTEEDGHHLLVAEVDGRVVGALHLVTDRRVRHALGEAVRVAIVEEIVVAAAERGRGHGRALMAAAEEMARTRGITSLHLHVWMANRDAVRFYEELGFAVERVWMSRQL